jgi:hypothetical protein
LKKQILLQVGADAMKIHFRNAFLVFMNCAIFLLAGCASWELKDRCEKTNWFEYSQKVAFDGKYLEEDGFIKDCKGVDRTSAVQLDLGFKQGREKMCQYDEIFTRAKEGVPVFFKFCDGLDMNRMKSLYTQGLQSYCTNEKGYSFGKAGKLYQNLCSPAQEKVFLPGYYKGRREYLNILLEEYGRSLAELKALEDSYARTENHIQNEYSTLPGASECRNENVYDEVAKQSIVRTICQEAFYVRTRRTDLWSQLDRVRQNLSEVRANWRKIENGMAQATLDLRQLP